MAIVALHSAATGLTAMSQDIDVIANNIANTNTNGFKSLRSNFEDLLYMAKEQPGVENANGDQSPAGLFVGLGTRISNTQLDLTTGPAVPDTGDFSMMIDGHGFFQVSLGDQIAYTRAGDFYKNAQGNLVLGNSDGPLLEGGLTIPDDVTDIQIQQDGRIFGRQPGAQQLQELGQITLATFVNPGGLVPIGKNLYLDSDASGLPIVGEPGTGAVGRINHKFLEGSNVEPVRELVSLIKTQRAFEMNSQTIQAADEALQVIANLGR